MNESKDKNVNEILRVAKQTADATVMFTQLTNMFQTGMLLVKQIHDEYKNDLSKEHLENIQEYLQRSSVIAQNISNRASPYGD